MLKLYNFTRSGNCYKVRLLLALLKLDYELVPVDMKNGEHKNPAFMALNPWGQVPVLGDGDLVLRDSQAILVYLAQRYEGAAWLPTEAKDLGLVMQWIMVAEHDIQQTLTAARAYYLFGRQLDIETATARAYSVLQIIDHHLAHRQWLELDRPTLADIACYPYIALAADGKISLADYPQVGAWCDRLKQLPGYIDLPGI